MPSLSADLVLINGRFVTLDPAQPHAGTVAIRAGRIVFVGDSDVPGLNIHAAAVIDCRSRTVLPGFIDAHCHLHAYAEGLLTLSLEQRSGIDSLDDIQKAIRHVSLTLPAGTWIRGRGYDEFNLEEKRHPNRWDLDGAASSHPVKISHRSGRAHVLNSLALSLVGITRETPDPPDGIIERDCRTAEPTGLLYGMGGYLSERIPPLADDELLRAVGKANENLLAAGITSLQDASVGNGRAAWLKFARWKQEGFLLSRVRMMFGFSGLRDYRAGNFSSALPGEELAAAGVKIVIDETTGRLLPDQRDLNEMVLEIHRCGLQAVLHAVEENAIDAACLAVEYALRKQPRPDHRHRIEHCSVCPPALAGRLASLGIMATTQPSFIYYHGERYRKTVPKEQVPYLYPLATLLRKGVIVAGSSDFPVAPPDLLAGVYSAVSRRSETGGLLLPQERIGPYQALLLYTDHAARSSFEEQDKGSITAGKLADLVVLSGDPRGPGKEEQIKDIQVLQTMVNGKIVWERGDD